MTSEELKYKIYQILIYLMPDDFDGHEQEQFAMYYAELIMAEVNKYCENICPIKN